MTYKIIDTNVPLVATGMSTDASTNCKRSCLSAISKVLSGKDKIVLDDGNEVLSEYRRQMHPDLIGSPAAQFMIHVLTNRFSDEYVHSIKLHRNADGRFEDYPDNQNTWSTEVPRCERFDPDDKKWVALALRFKKDTGRDAPIVNAADKCWLAFETQLESAGVKLEILCRDERERSRV